MRARTLLLILAVSLFGCAHDGHRNHPTLSAIEVMPTAQMEFARMYPGGILCGSVTCATVMVTVRGNCVISVDPPTLGIVKDQSILITWKIDSGSTGRVNFGPKGINPRDPTAWNREFDRERPGTTEWKWFDRNPHVNGNQQRKFKYNVDIVQDGRECRLDPTIVNDM